MNEFELQKIVEGEIVKVLEKAQSVYHEKAVVKFPKISFKLRGRTAGMCCKNNGEYTLKFNPVLLQANLQDFINRTIPHEVAHLLTGVLFPYAKSHGWEWRRVMANLGVNNITRCHTYDTSMCKGRVVTRPFVYACNCREHKLTRVIHNKILRGQRRWCLTCKATVRYVRTDFSKNPTLSTIQP